MLQWLTVFIDVPADRFGSTASFWAEASGSTISGRRGDRGQFVTLIPPAGDADLRMQVLDEGPRVHVDLHVDDVTVGRQRALDLGATEVADRGYSIMRSPGGFVFCLVSSHDEGRPSPPIGDPAPHLIDQLCIDVPAVAFGAECEFWADLVEADLRHSSEYPEFAGLPLGPQVGFDLLLQRLGDDDPRTAVDAHLDISCGAQAEAVADRHVELGAELVGAHSDWIVLKDPAGLHYCATSSPVNPAR